MTATREVTVARPPTAPRAMTGVRIALAVIVLTTVAILAEGAAGPSILVPESGFTYPDWEAGPLRLLSLPVIASPQTLGNVFSIALVVMGIAYGVVLLRARSVSLRTLVAVVVGLHAIVLLGPPMQLSDAFNYLGYARLGALHHLNPYTHGMSFEALDPVYLFTSWRHLRSPYGELFTILSYPLGRLPLPVAFWLIKVLTVGLSLLLLWLVVHCARRLGRDPRPALAFVALNPVFIVYELGGFHNDVLMLVPALAAVAWALQDPRTARPSRDRAAGAALVLAVAVKFTVISLGPFLLVGVGGWARRRRLIEGAALALVPVVAVSLALFGHSLPNLGQQSSLVSPFGVPNLVGLIAGVGGDARVRRLVDYAALAVVAWQLLTLLYRHRQGRGDWIAGAGWSTLALVLALSWTVPWYVVWVLPLAALSRSVALRRASLVLTAYLLLAVLPATSSFIADHHINPLDTPAGRASTDLQDRLAN